MKRLLPTTVLVAAAALLLGACGFQLRGALTLPVDIGPIEVVSPDTYSPLANALVLNLERQRAVAEVVGRASGDLAALNIISERWAMNPISVDQYGRAQEYNLRYAVFFDLRDAQGKLLVPQQGLELGRDFTSPPVDPIGTTGERELLENELRRDMVNAILRRIDTVLKLPGAAADEGATPGPH